MVHLSIGDKKACVETLVACNHNTGVIIGGTIGMIAGPVVSTGGGVFGGAVSDLMTAKMYKTITGEDVLVPTQMIIDAFTKEDAKPGEKFDAVTSIILDGINGLNGGKAIENNSKAVQGNSKATPYQRVKKPGAKAKLVRQGKTIKTTTGPSLIDSAKNSLLTVNPRNLRAKTENQDEKKNSEENEEEQNSDENDEEKNSEENDETKNPEEKDEKIGSVINLNRLKKYLNILKKTEPKGKL